MAPLKATAHGSSQPQFTTNTDSRVTKAVKRGARGYRKFRSGMLNVAPKAGEKLLVESNSKSTLLSLPPEIRNRIWTFALNNTKVEVYSVRKNSFRLRLEPSDRVNAMALLRTCRQIYHETAILPYKLNTFTASSVHNFTALVRELRTYQHTHISSLHIQFSCYRPDDLTQKWGPAVFAMLVQKLPALKRIELSVFDMTVDGHGPLLVELKDDLLVSLQAALPQVHFPVTIMEQSWDMYHMEWVKKP